MEAGAGRVVRSGPVFPVIVQVAEHVKVFLPTGGQGLNALPLESSTRGMTKCIMVARMAVLYPKDIALIRFQARKGHLLKVIHDALFLFRRYRVIWMPGEYPGSEFPFGVQRINKGASDFHIPAQHFRRQLVPARIIRAHKVVRGAVTAALAVWEDFHIHGGFSSAGCGGVSLNTRSKLTRAASTSIVSARLLWMFTHRASWFKFAPMRAS